MLYNEIKCICILSSKRQNPFRGLDIFQVVCYMCGIGREDKTHKMLDAAYLKFYEVTLDAILASQMEKYELL
jgi:hypothetical protein